MANVFRAAETTVKLKVGAVTVDSSSNLASLFTGDNDAIEKYMKNVTVVPPEGSVEIQNLLGTDENGFQNAFLDEKPYSVATLTGTLVLDRDSWDDFSGQLESLIAYPETITVDSTTYKRYQIGKISDGSSVGRPTIAALVELKHPYTGTPTEHTVFLFNNALMTKIGDYRISGPDSHWEVDIALTCLPKDFYREYVE